MPELLKQTVNQACRHRFNWRQILTANQSAIKRFTASIMKSFHFTFYAQSLKHGEIIAAVYE
jgi:hypothetical protein